MNKDYFPNKPYLNVNFNQFYPDVSQRNKAYSDLIEHFGMQTVNTDTDFQNDLFMVIHTALHDQDNQYNHNDIIQKVKEVQRVRNGMRVGRSERERSRSRRERSERERSERERSRSLGGSRTRRRTISSPFLKKMFTARRVRRGSSKARKARTTRRK
jgi:hypothetical protein